MLHHTGFDAWSGHYDHSISQREIGYPFEGYYNVLAFIRHQLHQVDQKTILDIGIGTGLLSHELYQQGATIWGIDFSPRMLQQAHEKMPQGTFILWDMTCGIPSEIQGCQFHDIISSYAIHHIQEQEQIVFLEQCVGLLHPGGSLLVGDIGFNTVAEREEAKTQFASTWDDDEQYLIGDRILAHLQDIGLVGWYEQISLCAGVLTIQKPT